MNIPMHFSVYVFFARINVFPRIYAYVYTYIYGIHTGRHTILYNEIAYVIFRVHASSAHKGVYIHTYVRTYVRTYIHTYICICICMCTYVHGSVVNVPGFPGSVLDSLRAMPGGQPFLTGAQRTPTPRYSLLFRTH